MAGSGPFAGLSRRDFLARASAVGGGAMLASWAGPIIERAYASDPGGNGGDFAGHGFECRQAEGFQFTRHQHEVGHGQQFVDPFLFAEEVHTALDPFVVGEPLG